jgi:peptide/nickel transport system permease protein
MFKYILRRLLQSVPLLFLISIILYLLLTATGDPVSSMGGRMPPAEEDRERLRIALGLDQPPLVQYFVWLVGNDWMRYDTDGDRVADTTFCPLPNVICVPLDSNGDGKPDPIGTRKGVIRGDFGTSLATRRPAIDMISERLPNTLLLMVTAQVVIVAVSLFVGIMSALKQYSVWDNALTTFSFVMYSVPVFLMAYLLSYIFAFQFRQWGLPYLPTNGMYDPLVGPTPEQVLRHMILPVTTISLISIAGYSRFIRSAMLEVINADYIRTARSKGIAERRILFVHAFKNASLPFVTLVGLDLPFLLAGAVVTESIFAWPGMGWLYIQQLQRSDFPVMMGILMMIAVAVVIFQILTDIVYSWLDPRIRFD